MSWRILLVCFAALFATVAWANDNQKIVLDVQQGKYEEAMKLAMKLAAQGDAQAEFVIGELYYQGQGVSKDYTKAAEWYQRAADQNFVAAEMNLAELYSKGMGVGQSDIQAFTLYMRAAKQGNSIGKYYVAASYASGKGVEIDLAEAYFWTVQVTNDTDMAKGDFAALYTKAQKVRSLLESRLSSAQIDAVKARLVSQDIESSSGAEN